MKTNILNPSPLPAYTASTVSTRGLVLGIKSQYFLILFFPLYLCISIAIGNTGAFDKWDLLFGFDAPRVVNDILGTHDIGTRSAVHPLFVLCFHWLGSLLSKHFARNLVLSAITATFGTATVMLAERFFYRIGIQNSFWFAAILGASTTMTFFASVPETGIFMAFGIVLLFYMAAINNRIGIAIASVFAIGMLITNAVVAGIIALFTLKRKSLILAPIVLLSVFALIELQSKIYPESAFSIERHNKAQYENAVSYDTKYASIPQSLPQRVQAEIYHFAIVDLVPANVAFGYTDGKLLYFDLLTFSFIGWLTFFAWWAIFLCAVSKASSGTVTNRFVKPLAFVVLFQFGLHFFYGFEKELFIYSASWIFPVVALVAIYFDGNRYAKYLLPAMLVLQLCSCYEFYSGLLRVIR